MHLLGERCGCFVTSLTTRVAARTLFTSHGRHLLHGTVSASNSRASRRLTQALQSVTRGTCEKSVTKVSCAFCLTARHPHNHALEPSRTLDPMMMLLIPAASTARPPIHMPIDRSPLTARFSPSLALGGRRRCRERVLHALGDECLRRANR